MKLFELFSKKSRVTESQRLFTETLTLCEDITKIIENNYDNSIDFEPQPEFRGVKGRTSDTGPSVHAAKLARLEKEKAQASQQSKSNLKILKIKFNDLRDKAKQLSQMPDADPKTKAIIQSEYNKVLLLLKQSLADKEADMKFPIN